MDWASYIEKTKSRYINYYTASAKRYTRNYAKLIESLPNMLNAVNEAWNCGNYRSVLEITEWLWSRGGQFLDRQRYMPESIELLNQAIKAAQLLGKRREEGHLLGHLGRAWMKSEKPREATKCFRQALEIAQEINDNQGVASNLGCLGQMLLDQNKRKEAADCFNKALVIARKINDKQMEGRLLGSIGLAIIDYEQPGSIDTAISYFDKALKIAKKTRDRRSEASHLGCLGLAWEMLCSRRPLPPYPQPPPELFTQGYYIRGVYAMDMLGYTERVTKREHFGGMVPLLYKEAIDYYEQALAIAREIGDKDLEDHFHKNVDRFRTSIAEQVINRADKEFREEYVARFPGESSGSLQSLRRRYYRMTEAERRHADGGDR